jgi:hypothetical protein
MQRLVKALCLLLLAACSGPGPSMPAVTGPTITPNPSASPTLTPFGLVANPSPLPATASTTIPSLSPATPVPVPPHYTLKVILDYAAHTLTVDESVIYQNATGQTLTDLVLAVEPNLWTGCFNLGSSTIDGQAMTGLNLSGDRLKIPLASPLVPYGILSLSLNFDLHLPVADTHHVFGYNDLQVNLVDWYPFIVPYSDGWLLHPPAEVGEHLVYDEAVFDVTITLSAPTLPVTIAASAPAETTAGTWHYLLHNARTFVFSASTAYQSAITTTDGVTVTSYYFKADKTQARAALEEVAKAVTTFSTLFGPFPYTSLSIVESPFYDGLEYDGLFFLSRNFYARYDGTVLNNLVDIAVHETAHQWWFGLVGNDQAMEPWLDETMATYSERLFYEKNYPEVTAWWTFRVDAYNPAGWVDTDIYHGGNFRSYSNAVYLRGAQFLEALRGRVGDEAFFAFLRDYTMQMAGKRATADDFFRILRRHSTADFLDIQKNYFERQH